MKHFDFKEKFEFRHIGPRREDVKEMLNIIGEADLDEFIKKVVPENIRLNEEIKIDAPITEEEFAEEISEIASKNLIFNSFIGMGYYPTNTPAVIKRNILENPGWYTQYTPYQAEISQGRLEALLNFQTMVSDLTGLKIANSSLLDEATAAAEAMFMLYSSRKRDKKEANLFLVSDKLFPQTIDVLRTRAEPRGIEIRLFDYDNVEFSDDVFGIIVQYPDAFGRVVDFRNLFKQAAEHNVFIAVAADFMSLVLLTPPGELGADVVVGSTQRFGVPMGFGGPHAAYFATKDQFKRRTPGRIIGVSVDSQGNMGLRMALQTREQHIKREKATSNICTAQVFLSIMASMYAVYKGPVGLKKTALKIHSLTQLLNHGIGEMGFQQINDRYFDTLFVKIDSDDLRDKIRKESELRKMNFNYYYEGFIGISLDETKTLNDVKAVVEVFAKSAGKEFGNINPVDYEYSNFGELTRRTEFLTHPVFNSYHSETEMMRYIKNLENKDLSLTKSMIPLGSCTMKLNAASVMYPISYPGFADLHPFAPENQTRGYSELISKLEKQLCALTGFSAVSFQPNSGAQGEYTGLSVIRQYHKFNGNSNRNVVLIPSSAHGTNPASAMMAGGKVVIVACDERGNIDIEDLRAKAEEHSDDLAALMVTYPSTHGVFEAGIREICEIIHNYGGLVYMDGANLNAQVGLTSPAYIGADVCHLNLHKTFAIPHGGGGPGMGPIAVTAKLSKFLPEHVVNGRTREESIHAVSSAHFGSAAILPISYGYIRMLGAEGLKNATKFAILTANYIMKKLEPLYKTLYTGESGYVAHELIFDVRDLKHSAHVDVEDIAKRLMDYGFHAPTVSFPVPGTLMIEPTESESKKEIDRFCEALTEIRKEIEDIETGKADENDNALKNAPHTAEVVASDNWEHSYSRSEAAFPLPWVKSGKFWPSVGRIDNAYGDRNLVCTCPPIEDYQN